ncbi:MAG TPA: LysE family translocator [Accumulibacter sp.]|jgi:threonine/homoserine/homoserine lactone efflux protein|nr:LysE family translocator [Accumulibacter sp.]HQC79235.1 LysE family translocator [Accumulibacter sp.]
MFLPPTDAPTLPAFLLASLLLAVTPGPGVAYILARTFAQGRRAGLCSVAGVATGNLVNAIIASIGLAALLALSPLVFATVKYAGALYLVYLGLKTFRAAPSANDAGANAVTASARRRIFRDGLLVAALNPKTALFFAAFLPQFYVPAVAAIWQSLLLGVLFVLIAAMTDSLYVLGAGALRPLLARRCGPVARLPLAHARHASGSALIGLGILGALSGAPGG